MLGSVDLLVSICSAYLELRKVDVIGNIAKIYKK